MSTLSRDSSDSHGGIPEVRLILVGNIGCGKTLTADTLLNDSSSISALVPSRLSEVRRGVSEGRHLRIVETPRWYWKGDHVDANVQRETERALSLVAPGPHTFLILVPVGQFTEMEGRIPSELERVFGRGALEHSLVLLTCGDYLIGRDHDRYVRLDEPGLSTLINECGGCWHVINNRRPEDRQQVESLLEKVKRLTERSGGCYLPSATPRDADERVNELQRRYSLQEKELMHPDYNTPTQTAWSKEEVWDESGRRGKIRVRSIGPAAGRVASQQMANGLYSQSSYEDSSAGLNQKRSSFKLSKEGAILSQMSETEEPVRSQNNQNFINAVRYNISTMSDTSPASPSIPSPTATITSYSPSSDVFSSLSSTTFSSSSSAFSTSSSTNIFSSSSTMVAPSSSNYFSSYSSKTLPSSPTSSSFSSSSNALSSSSSTNFSSYSSQTLPSSPTSSSFSSSSNALSSSSSTNFSSYSSQTFPSFPTNSSFYPSSNAWSSSSSTASSPFNAASSSSYPRTNASFTSSSTAPFSSSRSTNSSVFPSPNALSSSSSTAFSASNALFSSSPRTNASFSSSSSAFSSSSPSTNASFSSSSSTLSSYPTASASSFSSGSSASSNELKLVLMGRAGSGKSAAGNAILGRDEFKLRRDDATGATTQSCVKGTAVIQQKRVTVVDTPDWFGPSCPPESLATHLSSCMDLCAPGPHAFLFCVPVTLPGRSNLHDLGFIKNFFGPEAIQRHTLVLFTHSDMLKDGNVEEYIAAKRPELLELVEKCGDRYHVLKQERNGANIDELLERLEQVVKESGGSHYSYQGQAELGREMMAQLRRGREDNVDRTLSSTLHSLREEEEVEQEEKNAKPVESMASSITSVLGSVLRFVGQKVGEGAKQVPKLVAGGAVLGGVLGLYVGGPVGGAVGATAGTVATEYGRRKYSKPKTD